MRGKIIVGLKLLFTPAALFSLLYFAWLSKSELAELISHASLNYLYLAAILWGLLHALSPVLACAGPVSQAHQHTKGAEAELL